MITHRTSTTQVTAAKWQWCVCNRIVKAIQCTALVTRCSSLLQCLSQLTFFYLLQKINDYQLLGCNNNYYDYYYYWYYNLQPQLILGPGFFNGIFELHNPFPTFPSLFTFLLPIPPLHHPSPSSRGPSLNPARESGERCKLPSGSGQSPATKRLVVHFELRVLLVIAILKFSVEQIANLLDKTYFIPRLRVQFYNLMPKEQLSLCIIFGATGRALHWIHY